MTTTGNNPESASLGSQPHGISRRFCLAPALARLIKRERPAVPIVEGHFPDQSDRRSYVRMQGDHCLLVLEDRDAEGALEEERSEVSRAQGEVLLDVCAGKTTFERISLEAAHGVMIHIDRFTSPVSASFIEFSFADPAAAKAFRPPIWIGAELGADDVGDSRRIALGGKPKLFEGSIHNSALDSLLDLLDQRAARYGSYLGGDDQMMSALRRLVKQPGDQGETDRPTGAEFKKKVETGFMMIDDVDVSAEVAKRVNGGVKDAPDSVSRQQSGHAAKPLT